MAGPNSLGDSDPRCVGRRARFHLRNGLALIALAGLAFSGVSGGYASPVRGAQDSRAALFERARELVAVLASSDRDQRPSEFDALAELEFELQGMLGAVEPEDRDLCISLFRIASVLGEHDEWSSIPDRLECVARAREYAELAGNAEAQARARWLGASLLQRLGKNGEARRELIELVADLPEARLTLPYALLALADVERQLGQFSAALDRLSEVEDRITDGDPRLAPLVWRVAGRRAQTLLDLGLVDRAAPFVARELEATAALPLDVRAWDGDRIAARIHAANLALVRGDLHGCLEFTEPTTDPSSTTVAGRNWSSTLLALRGAAELGLVRAGELPAERARETLESAIASNEMPERDRVFAQLRLAALEVDEQRFERAEQLVTEVRSTLAGWRTDPSRAPFTNEVVEVATLAARLAVQRGDPEMSLRRSLEEMSGVTDGLLEIWAETPLRAGGIGFLKTRARRALFSERVRIQLALEGTERGAHSGLQEMMRVQSYGSTERELGLEPGDVERARAELLQPNCGALIFLPAPDQSHLFVLDAVTLEVFELPGTDRIDPIRERWLVALSRVPAEDSREQERELARTLARELLPAEVVARIGAWKGITIVGSDLWGRIPVGELLTPDGKRLASHSIDYLPSLPLGLWLASRSRGLRTISSQDRVRLIAPDAGASARDRWPALTAFTWDQDVVDEMLDEADGTVLALAGDQATPSALFRATADATRSLEVVAHGVQDHERERPALLVLAADGDDDGLVSAERIEAGFGDEGPPELVILAACRTARGPQRPGDGSLANLAGAFIRAGTRAVILSDADLPFLDTVELLEVLQDEMRVRGLAPAEALTRAVSSLEGSRDAALLRRLHVVGLGQVPIFEAKATSRRMGVITGALAVLGLIAATWLVGRRRGREG